MSGSPFAGVAVPEYPGSSSPGRKARAPATILAASVLTILGAVAVLVFAALLLIVVLAAGAPEVRQDLAPFDVTQVRLVFGALTAYNALLGIALVVLNKYVKRRRIGARIAMTVIGAFNVGVLLIPTFAGSPWYLLGVVYIAVAVALYWTALKREYV